MGSIPTCGTINMNRRELLKLLALGAAGTTLDVEKLLWVPGQKTIFLPTVKDNFSIVNLYAIEYERAMKNLHYLFDRDTLFYKAIKRKDVNISGRGFLVPLNFLDR